MVAAVCSPSDCCCYCDVNDNCYLLSLWPSRNSLVVVRTSVDMADMMMSLLPDGSWLCTVQCLLARCVRLVDVLWYTYFGFDTDTLL